MHTLTMITTSMVTHSTPSTTVADRRPHPTATENTTDRVGVTLGVVLVVMEWEPVVVEEVVSVGDTVADCVDVGDDEAVVVSVDDAVPD